ncbi:hypothetical protein AGMMS4957_13710 [Bacteroidia bacterium]|nr:hypothetical protein AGMMS4957_13710 [Bacteroidia bacterium]
MDIKNISGSRVGFVEGDNIKDNYGNKIGYVDGNQIRDAYGQKVGYIDGENYIMNTSGNRLAYVDGENYIKDISGSRLGFLDGGGTKLQKCAAGLVLLGILAYSNDSGSSYSSSGSGSSEKKSGCLGWILAFFVWLPFGGKICALIGIALPIVDAIINQSYNNILFIIPFGFLVGAGIGSLGNFVIPKLSKAGKLGTLIGAVVIGVSFGVSTGDIIFATAFGSIAGAIIGAIIGSIVGFIMKLTKKGK